VCVCLHEREREEKKGEREREEIKGERERENREIV